MINYATWVNGDSVVMKGHGSTVNHTFNLFKQAFYRALLCTYWRRSIGGQALSPRCTFHQWALVNAFCAERQPSIVYVWAECISFFWNWWMIYLWHFSLIVSFANILPNFSRASSESCPFCSHDELHSFCIELRFSGPLNSTEEKGRQHKKPHQWKAPLCHPWMAEASPLSIYHHKGV